MEHSFIVWTMNEGSWFVPALFGLMGLLQICGLLIRFRISRLRRKLAEQRTR